VNVYLVTSGAYSDYGIEAAFTSEELADQYIVATRSRHIGSHARVEKFDLWDTLPVVDPPAPTQPDWKALGHWGVEHEKVAGIAVYTCQCGWRDLYINFQAHLASVIG